MNNFIKTEIVGIDYKVNQNKKSVTCELHGSCVFPGVMLNREYFKDKDVTVHNTCYEVQYTVFGVSKCHPDDDFDIETGVEIAKSRAYKKLFITVRDDFKKYAKSLRQLSGDIDLSIEKYNRFIDSEKHYINKHAGI